MTDLILKPGCEVNSQDKVYRIQAPVDLEHVLLEDITTHEQTTPKIIDLKPAIDQANWTLGKMLLI